MTYKRFFDIFLSLILMIPLVVVFLFILILIKIDSEGEAIYYSKRVGLNGNLFLMPKFRTMKLNTPDVATEALEKPEEWVTNLGIKLRKSSLDELPQLWSIFIGDMSFVGPRPALHNQYDLIGLREKYRINSIRPGLTGWAQVNGRDLISIDEKVKLDKFYLENQSFVLDIRILYLTFIAALKKENISH